MIWQKKPVSSKRELTQKWKLKDWLMNLQPSRSVYVLRRRKDRLLRPKLRLPVLRKKD